MFHGFVVSLFRGGLCVSYLPYVVLVSSSFASVRRNALRLYGRGGCNFFYNWRYVLQMKGFTIIFFLWLNAISSQALNMSVEDCLSFYENHQCDFENIAKKYNCNVAEVAAVALPEVARYMEWQNSLENYALWNFYIDGGKESADFSIGYFQMKPSFIEKLECSIVEDECLTEMYSNILPYGNFSEKESRKYRLEQLNVINNQFEYLCIYFKIMENKYSNDFSTNNERIKFFAAAYNYGFNQKKEDIIKWMSVKGFPYGRRFNFEQDAFADVAAYLYDKIKINDCK